MPYKTKGKCVYKKDTGKKVGCTDGSVKDYLAALHMHTNEELNMQIKDSEFKQIVKEEFSRILKEDEVQVHPGGTWGPPPDLSAPQDIRSLSDDLVTKIMDMSEESPDEAQEALETLTATLDSAGVLDAMCSTTQGVMGFGVRESQLKQIIKEELSNITEDSPRNLLVTVLTSRMEEEKDRLQSALPNSNVSNSEWRSAVDMARDAVFPEVEPESQSTSWLDAPPTMPPPQKPFSVTEPGVRPTLQERIKKILNEE